MFAVVTRLALLGKMQDSADHTVQIRISRGHSKIISHEIGNENVLKGMSIHPSIQNAQSMTQSERPMNVSRKQYKKFALYIDDLK